MVGDDQDSQDTGTLEWWRNMLEGTGAYTLGELSRQ